ncbi:dihydrolipoyl dehydrogenase family protein [Roseovarius arcticus]|uniref:dihydrolipoyl dehydrogenase family protein n=1 Tax=Roseovarius arcticus TaxID=2547404 RepID=UPI001110BC0C|nr:NAD(P)/FAD-dependent oxidoreductase [Roseovarius arcticus]
MTQVGTSQSKDTVDILVIGGGPGGTPAAMALAQAGRRVLLVEAGVGLGGTCLFSGCIPSKIFRETAYRRSQIARGGDFGLEVPLGWTGAVDWTAVQTRRHKILSGRSAGALTNAGKLRGLEVAFGHAQITGARSAIIQCSGQPQRAVTFERAIIATGSVPNRLPILGGDLPSVLDSEGLIDIEAVPSTLVLIGGGPIGVEMAQIFAMLGSDVTLLEAGHRILGQVDAPLAALLTEHLKATGVTVQTDVQIEQIKVDDSEHHVSFSHKGETRSIAAQVVAIVAGRHPNVDGLGLETTAVKHGLHGIKVNEQLETDEPGLFAIGDVAGNPMFAHWATAQALAVARYIIGLPTTFPKPEYNSAVIFSSPEIGMVGLTEEVANAAGLEVAVAEYDYKIDARAQISGENLGRLRIIYRRSDHRIVGVHALIEGAADLVGEAALAVRNGLTLEQLASSIHPHPTLTEAFGIIARGAIASSLRGMPPSGGPA